MDMQARLAALFDELERVCPEILPANARAIPPLSVADVLRRDLARRLALGDGFTLRMPFGAFCDVLMRRLRAMPNAVEEEQPNPERCGAQLEIA